MNNLKTIITDEVCNVSKKNSFTTKIISAWMAVSMVLLAVVGCSSPIPSNPNSTESVPNKSLITVTTQNQGTRIVQSVTGDTFFIHCDYSAFPGNLKSVSLEFRTDISGGHFYVPLFNTGVLPTSIGTPIRPLLLTAPKDPKLKPFWPNVFNLTSIADFVGVVSPSIKKIYTLVGVVDCKVSFDTDNGTPVKDISFEKSVILPPVILSEPQSPTKEGFIFDGWYRDSARTTIFDFKLNPLSSNIKLYAKWKENVLSQLKRWISLPAGIRTPLSEQSFAKVALAASEVDGITQVLYDNQQREMLAQYQSQWDNRELKFQGYSMPFYYKKFGTPPADGKWSLIISMHGGGQASQATNDDFWEGQKYLYDGEIKNLPGGTIFLAPRGPSNTWNLWSISEVDDFFNIIIQIANAKEGIDFNRVYLHGVSAGGDGVYQLAPRIADRFAAVAMLMGHPNDASPLSLRNLPFAIHVGADDASYNRNGMAIKWGQDLDKLRASDPGGYIHDVHLYPNTGHGLAGQDVGVFAWLEGYTRNPIPQKVVWRQNDSYRQHQSSYWLKTPVSSITPGGVIVADYAGQVINISEAYSDTTCILLNDKMMNLDLPVTVKYQGKAVFTQTPTRTVLNIYNSIQEKGDKNYAFSASLKFVKP